MSRMPYPRPLEMPREVIRQMMANNPGCFPNRSEALVSLFKSGAWWLDGYLLPSQFILDTPPGETPLDQNSPELEAKLDALLEPVSRLRPFSPESAIFRMPEDVQAPWREAAIQAATCMLMTAAGAGEKGRATHDQAIELLERLGVRAPIISAAA